MNYNIFKLLKSYSSDPVIVDRIITSSYIEFNNLTVCNNYFLQNYIINKEDQDYADHLAFCKLLHKYCDTLTLENLIELFEFVISPLDKVVNGAVYTPSYIREYIVNVCLGRSTKKIGDLRIGDIACGCGGFFVTIAELFHNKYKSSFREIFANNIFGLDIAEFSITRTKIILSLLALTYGEDDNFNFNLYLGDALTFDWYQHNKEIKINGGFDIIVGNPPYVCSKNLSSETRELSKSWSVAKIGNTDLYIPFFQIAFEALATDGLLGFITVNSFIKSLNGRELRNYLSGKNVDLSIVDFGGEQVFRGRTTYTCICLLQKRYAESVKYVKSPSKNISILSDKEFYDINYTELNNHKGWTLSSDTIRKNINRIESTGVPLGKMVDIRNGLATLMNNVYIFTPIKEDQNFYYLTNGNREYKIEREICRDIIKPNILKFNNDIETLIEKLIFPYTTENDQLRIIDEKLLIKYFPEAYNYLLSNKVLLSTRDKGKKEYERWYAFGRNQALTLRGYKLFFPYISDKPYFVFSDYQDLLFYNGYAIISDKKEELLTLSKLLNSKVFWYYIYHNSKPYSSNYYAFAKNHIINFGVCNLTEKEKQYVLATDDYKLLDDFFIRKYHIDIDF